MKNTSKKDKIRIVDHLELIDPGFNGDKELIKKMVNTYSKLRKTHKINIIVNGKLWNDAIED